MTEIPSSPDPGLARERTDLAWQRSALALAVASVVIGRLTFGRVGAIALAVVALGLAHTAVIFRASRRHYRQRKGLTPSSGWSPGVHVALLSVQVALLGALELVELARM